jgi:hypothetical protein
MVCFCNSTICRNDSAVALAASVAAHVFPKSKRSWDAVTVALVVTTCEVMTWLGIRPCAPGFKTPAVWVTTWFWNPPHCPLSCGSSGESASKTRCRAAA